MDQPARLVVPVLPDAELAPVPVPVPVLVPVFELLLVLDAEPLLGRGLAPLPSVMFSGGSGKVSVL